MQGRKLSNYQMRATAIYTKATKRPNDSNDDIHVNKEMITTKTKLHYQFLKQMWNDVVKRSRSNVRVKVVERFRCRLPDFRQRITERTVNGRDETVGEYCHLYITITSVFIVILIIIIQRYHSFEQHRWDSYLLVISQSAEYTCARPPITFPAA